MASLERSPLLPIALVLALAVAGCATPEEAVEGASTEGGAAPTAAPVQDAAGEPPTAAIPGGARDLAFQGSFGAGAVVCPMLTCASAYPVPNERLYDTGAAAGAYALSVTMEWTPTSPHNEQLVLGAFTCDPDRCDSDTDLSWLDAVAGPAPLAFEADVEVADGETLYVFANPMPVLSGGPVFLRTSTPQDFAIQGTLMSEEREANVG